MKKKMYISSYKEKKQITVDILIKNIMPKECVITAIINMEETRNLGIVHMINCMLMECVKIATSTHIIESVESRKLRISSQEVN